MKILLNVQSISDVITNSSSEIFCIIDSDNEARRELIYDMLKSLFGYFQDPESNFYVDFTNKEKYKNFLKEEAYNKLSDKIIEVDIPYTFLEYKDSIQVGLSAMLDEEFGKNNYMIIYDNFE